MIDEFLMVWKPQSTHGALLTLEICLCSERMGASGGVYRVIERGNGVGVCKGREDLDEGLGEVAGEGFGSGSGGGGGDVVAGGVVAYEGIAVAGVVPIVIHGKTQCALTATMSYRVGTDASGVG